MLGKNANPLLLKTVQQMEAKVDPAVKGAFQRVLLAGEKVMYSPQSRQLAMSELHRHGDPAVVVGTAVAKLMGVLMGQAKGTIPPKALVPGATVLLCEALDVAEQAGLVKVDENVLANAMHTMSSALLQLLGVGPDKLNRIMQSAKQQQQPQPAAPPQAPPVPPQAAAPTAGGLVAQAQGAAQ